jgi:CBS domain-containing protein
MWDGDCGVVPVLDQNGKVVGLITDRDICMATYTQGLPPHTICVKNVMAKDLIGCAPSDTVAHAEKLMREHRVRRLPVIDNSGTLVGILSLNDVAREYLREKVSGQRDVRGGEIAETLGTICQPRPITLRTHAA